MNNHTLCEIIEGVRMYIKYQYSTHSTSIAAVFIWKKLE